MVKSFFLLIKKSCLKLLTKFFPYIFLPNHVYFILNEKKWQPAFASSTVMIKTSFTCLDKSFLKVFLARRFFCFFIFSNCQISGLLTQNINLKHRVKHINNCIVKIDSITRSFCLCQYAILFGRGNSTDAVYKTMPS